MGSIWLSPLQSQYINSGYKILQPPANSPNQITPSHHIFPLFHLIMVAATVTTAVVADSLKDAVIFITGRGNKFVLESSNFRELQAYLHFAAGLPGTKEKYETEFPQANFEAFFKDDKELYTVIMGVIQRGCGCADGWISPPGSANMFRKHSQPLRGLQDGVDPGDDHVRYGQHLRWQQCGDVADGWFDLI